MVLLHALQASRQILSKSAAFVEIEYALQQVFGRELRQRRGHNTSHEQCRVPAVHQRLEFASLPPQFALVIVLNVEASFVLYGEMCTVLRRSVVDMHSSIVLRLSKR